MIRKILNTLQRIFTPNSVTEYSEVLIQVRDYMCQNEAIILVRSKGRGLKQVRIPIQGAAVDQAHIWIDRSLQIWTKSRIKFDICATTHMIYGVFPIALEKVEHGYNLIVVFEHAEPLIC